MIYLLCLAVYLVAGLFYERHQLARFRYYKSVMTRCSPSCKSRDWSRLEYKRKYCTCGFLKNGTYDTNMALILVPVWILHALVSGTGQFVSGGSYEPKEVKAARKELEENKKIQESEERLKVLERELGIRTD